jgi:hypothetical protein
VTASSNQVSAPDDQATRAEDDDEVCSMKQTTFEVTLTFVAL